MTGTHGFYFEIQTGCGLPSCLCCLCCPCLSLYNLSAHVSAVPTIVYAAPVRVSAVSAALFSSLLSSLMSLLSLLMTLRSPLISLLSLLTCLLSLFLYLRSLLMSVPCPCCLCSFLCCPLVPSNNQLENDTYWMLSGYFLEAHIILMGGIEKVG